MLRKFLILALLLTVIPLSVMAQDDGSEVRAIWNTEILVVINVGDDGADLSGLTFESANGAITAEDWVMNVDEMTTFAYPLTDVRPGDCLVAYFTGTDPELPAQVTCTREIGVFTPTTFDDLVWDVSQGGFTAVIEGGETVECDINRTSCDIDAPPGREPEMDESVPETVEVRALWTTDLLVLINTTDYGANLTGVSFTNANGAINPTSWLVESADDGTPLFDLADARPGSCLVAYFIENETQPDLPENVTCTEIIGAFTLENLDDMVWDVSAGGFSANVADGDSVACDITGSSCAFEVPTAESEFMEPEEDEIEADTNLRAVWTTDIFVLLNTGEVGVDVSNLRLESSNGEIAPDNWIMALDENGALYTLDDMRPGSCLISYFVDQPAQPDLPELVECTRTIGEFTPINLGDVIWDVTGGGFTPIDSGVAGDFCEIEGTTSCNIEVPETD
jgi:hypothetical protein